MSNRSHEEILATVLSKLAKFKRKSWKPIVRDGEDIPASSKFGGTPVLCQDENWPLCGACQSPMRFYLQLNSQELPQTADPLFEEGILQLFYCSSSQCDCNTDYPHYPLNPRGLVRVIDFDLITSDVTPPKMIDPIPSSIHEYFFKPRLISGWEEIDDYINFVERETIGFYLNDYDDDFEPDEDEEYNLAHDLCYAKDKLAGWTDWANYTEVAKCPICNSDMNKLIFQIGCHDNVSWGDDASSCIFRCPEHLEQITVLWWC
jgi:uncharacterized protein YwqG